MDGDGYDLITVGHFVIDLISSPQIEVVKPVLGGPPTYTSVAASKLGSKTSVISKVGENFEDDYVEWLTLQGVDLTYTARVKGARTTSFSIEYFPEGRRMRLLHLAPPITLEDFPTPLECEALHIAPVAGEVSPHIVRKLRRDGILISLDLQGFLRSFDDEGRLTLAKLKNTDMLRYVDVLKASEMEILRGIGSDSTSQAKRWVSRLGVEILVVTKGEGGADVYIKDRAYSVPAYKVENFIDPTGAGDAFMGGFLAEHLRGEDPLWCMCVGSATASFTIEGVGPINFRERKEVYERSEILYKTVS